MAQSAGHLSARQVVVGHLDHRWDAIMVARRLDRVLDAVVGVPVLPAHPRQIAAVGCSLGLLGRPLVVGDADDVGFGDGLVVAVV